MRESIFVSGNSRELIGIFTQPKESASKEQPIVVMLNAGLLHRVGPFRLHVSLCRKLADAGFSSLRVDLSGIGDSAVVRENLDELKRAEEDVRYFLDSLTERFGVTRFLLLGLCSGADNAHYISVRDKRVVGIVLLDGYAFPNFRYRVNYVVSRLLAREKWNYFLTHPTQLVSRVKGRLFRSSEHVETFTRYFPDQTKVVSDQQRLMERGVNSLHIFTGGSYEYFNYHDQFADLFPDYFASNLPEVVFHPEMDHTYSQCRHREELGRLVVDWTTRHFAKPQNVDQTTFSSLDVHN